MDFFRFPVAIASAEIAAMLVISALVDLADNADVTVPFLVASVPFGGWAALELRRVPQPSVTSAPAVMTMATVAFASLIAGGAVAHALADATDSLDGAVFEAAAAGTTTAMTGLDADSLPMGMHMFRALMQWIAGFGALVMALIVIPLVFGGRELGGRGQSQRGGRTLITARTRGTRYVVAIYGGFTAAMVVGYLVAGMGAFDAVAHAMATVSTGGLSTRTGSLAAFDSAAIEWVATIGMIVAGTSVGVVWWILQRERRALSRSSELRAWLLVMVLSFIAVSAWVGGELSGGDALRTAAVTVASAMSTTGFTTADWSRFDNGAQTLLLVLIGVGAMSGSAGGGFRYLRVIQAFRFAGRELKRQLHPSAVGVVRVNGRAVDERTLERMTAFVVVFILVVAAGGMLIELGDSGVSPNAAISLSISAVSTAGPQVTEPVVLADLGAVSKLSMAGLMLVGRLSIYAVILAFVNAISRTASAIEDRWWERG